MPSALSEPTLSTSERGSVRRCPCCDRLGVRFVGVDVALTPDQLRRMARTVASVRAEAAPWGWALRAETAGQRVVFPLAGADADEFGDLLDAAVAVLDLDALLLHTLGPRPVA